MFWEKRIKASQVTSILDERAEQHPKGACTTLPLTLCQVASVKKA